MGAPHTKRDGTGDFWEYKATTGDYEKWRAGGPKEEKQRLGVPYLGHEAPQ